LRAFLWALDEDDTSFVAEDDEQEEKGADEAADEDEDDDDDEDADPRESERGRLAGAADVSASRILWAR
jgi:hypothetical protein